MMYSPPFKITSRILNLVAEISAKIERYAILLEQDTTLRLRKANRIKTIYSSLAIEGNELTEGQVRDIINGRNVVAPLREIQEVKNAIATYDLFPTLNPFDEKDLLHPLFAHLPVENMVFSNQQAYYDAITSSTAMGESTPFIEFMLGEILTALLRGEDDTISVGVEYVPIKVQGIFPNNVPNIFPNNVRSKYPQVADVVWYVASLLNNTPGASADQIGKAIGISGRMVRNHIATLRNLGIIERIGSNKSGYWKVIRIEEEGGKL